MTLSAGTLVSSYQLTSGSRRIDIGTYSVGSSTPTVMATAFQKRNSRIYEDCALVQHLDDSETRFNMLQHTTCSTPAACAMVN